MDTYNPHTNARIECKFKVMQAMEEQARDCEWMGDVHRAAKIRAEIKRLEQSKDNFIARF